MNESLFLKGSMLLEIKDFKEAEKKLKLMYILYITNKIYLYINIII